MICVFLGYIRSNFVNKLDVTNVNNHVNLKDSTVNLVLSLFKQCSRVQIFFCFFVERNSMHSSYMLWNKFQDYHIRFILTDHFLVRRFDGVTSHL